MAAERQAFFFKTVDHLEAETMEETCSDVHSKADKDSFDEASFSEKQIYSNALDRLARELAAMKKLDKETAAKELENILKSAA